VLQFDFKAIEIVSYKGRIRKVRTVPTTEGLEQALRNLYALTNPEPSDLVFPVKSFKRSWATLCGSVGVSGVWLRDFRHYYNSVILQRPDINDVERMILMGHTQVKTNIRYSKLGTEFIEKYRGGFSSS
jgi:integrase